MRFLRWMVPSTLVLMSVGAFGSDWPQFRGPDRNGISKETGLLKQWPTEGPKLVWKADNLGDGHATPCVAGGRIYGLGLRGADEVVWALDEKTGKQVWSTRIAAGITLQAQQGGYGSRGTPTVEGTRLYAEGVSGALVCLNVADGKPIWQKSLVEDFGGNVPTWGYSESPLIDGEKLIVTPGGGANTIVCLNKATGAKIWASSIPEASRVAYSSAIAADFGGARQYIQFMAKGVIGISAKDGKFLWIYSSPANRNGISCSMPLYKDGYVFAATAYQTGGGLAKLSGSGDAITATEVYFTRGMMNHHGGMVVIGDYLYGFNERQLTCLDFKTGELKWENPSVGKGSVTFADGHLVARSERGPVALVEATPTGYVEKGRFDQPERSMAPSWPYPVVANGKLLLRDQGIMLCYDVKAASAKLPSATKKTATR